MGLTAAEVSFAKASELLAVLAGVDVETRQVERCAEALGRDIADDERVGSERTAPAPAPTMYLGLDGTGVPVRPAEVEGRRGKQPDGSVKTREVKLVTVWTAETRDKQGRPRRDTGSVSYNGAVESAASRDTDPQPAAFAQRVHREAQWAGMRRGEVRALSVGSIGTLGVSGAGRGVTDPRAASPRSSAAELGVTGSRPRIEVDGRGREGIGSRRLSRLPRQPEGRLRGPGSRPARRRVARGTCGAELQAAPLGRPARRRRGGGRRGCHGASGHGRAGPFEGDRGDQVRRPRYTRACPPARPAGRSAG